LKAITTNTKASYSKKGSKFIGLLFPVQSADAFDKKIAQIKNQYHDASHHCYAWRINPHQKKEFAQDDGEPGGTAGLPILNQLKSFEAVNCACTVIRYFGGTKLGKSGLINAYGSVAKACLQKAELKTLVATQNFEINYPYSAQSHINQLKNNFDLKEVKATYLQEVCIKMGCRISNVSAFVKAVRQLKHLGIKIEKNDKSFVLLND